MTPPPAHLPHEHLEDFTKLEWCTTLLSDPSITKIRKRTLADPTERVVSNSFFSQTLFTDEAVRAFLSLYRPGREGMRSRDDAIFTSHPDLVKDQKLGARIPADEPEALLLVSLGSGVDGGVERLHGGLTATLLDHVMGSLISYLYENTSATAELNVKYRIAIGTPRVLLCKARVAKRKGRWVETVGWVEDGMGLVFAEGCGSFVLSRGGEAKM